MIIKSILDTDLYKFTTSYAYMKLFPQARGTFEFIDRDNTEYPEDFIERLYLELGSLGMLHLAKDERWANAETYQTAGRMDLSAVEADEAEILEELLPKEPTKEELNAALLKLALDKGWYDDNEEHDIHPVQIPKNQMGIAVKELKAKYPAADGKKIADLVKANLCN